MPFLSFWSSSELAPQLLTSHLSGDSWPSSLNPFSQWTSSLLWLSLYWFFSATQSLSLSSFHSRGTKPLTHIPWKSLFFFFFLPWMCFTSRPCPLVRIYLPISTSSFRSGVFKTSLDHDSVTLRRAGNPITRLDSVTCDSTLSFFIFYSIPIYKVWVSRPANTVYIRWEACFVTVQIPFNHLSIMNSTSLIRIATALIYDNVPETR